MFRSLLLLFGVSGLVAAQVQAPTQGFLRASDQTLRPVYGIPGAYVLGQPIASGVSAAAFGDGGGEIAQTGQIVLVDRYGKQTAACPTQELHPVLGIAADGSGPLAWLPSTGTIVYWDANQCNTVQLSPASSGQVLDLRRDGNSAHLLTADRGALLDIAIDLASGQLTGNSLLSQNTASAVWNNTALMIADTSVEAPASGLRFERMSGDHWHATSSDATRHWVFEEDGAQVHWFEIAANGAPTK